MGKHQVKFKRITAKAVALVLNHSIPQELRGEKRTAQGPNSDSPNREPSVAAR